MRPRYRICRACGKRCFATQESAERELAHLQGTLEHAPVRAYECSQEWWHLTSQELAMAA